MYFSSKLITACLVFVATSAFAIEDDQIRGEVLAVDEKQKNIKIEITETGDDVKAKIGATETFMLSEDVDLEVELEDRRYQPYAAFTFADIVAGDTVLLDFDTQAAPREVIWIRAEEPKDMKVRERIEKEGRIMEKSGHKKDMDQEGY